MKRLYIGLTLLLMAFLTSLDQLDAVHRFVARAGVQRWMTELALSLAAVAFFARRSSLHRRMLFPRRGLRLLLAGIAAYALGLAVISGLLARAAGMLPIEAEGPWASVPGVLAFLRPLPLFIAAEALLVVGAFRALTNLVPPDEFAADF
ncbi:hypothetical protein HHL11_20775 [Ramlibacter sp. G-1-2-2]|uniref:Uncharacterized protein n=1 Tax=Ramlibacter agri TaxID=2728837 RepID=A0A848H5X5_9BURK|nr:hypothetical protein [Ramlibacter agri]NML46195.1 hypothetical protein [Ramlibacter agri]